jgi:HAD superfamily hydrolase (TIGR01509 family)
MVRGDLLANSVFLQTSKAFPTQRPSHLNPVMTPRAVIFDMDGLMFNTEDVYFDVGTELMRRRGREYTRQLSDAVMGRPPQACFETMIRWHNLNDRWEAMAEESEDLFISLLDGRLVPMPGLMELLDALEAAGLPKAICTSSSRRVLTAVLSRFDLEPRFAFTLTAEDITHGKPHPEIYLKAAERLGLPPGEIVVLEDSQTGCRAAAAAGTVVVAVPCEHSRNQDFSVASLILDGLDDRRLYALLGL